MLRNILLASLVFFTFQVQAAFMEYDGNFTHVNDYETFDLSFSETSDVSIWTDSFNLGFDPILSLYDSTGSRIAQNDDSLMFSGQEGFDSTLLLDDLLGSYTLAITRWNNFPGTTLSTAFSSIVGGSLLGDASYYHINVDSQVSAVPAPPAIYLMASGLIGIFYNQKRKKNLISDSLAA